MTTNERDRVRRFREGDPAVFEELFAEHGESLYRTCRRLCGNSSDAEDLVAETFVAAFEGRRRFNGQSSLKRWLFRIAVNKWRDLMKRSHRKDGRLTDEVLAFDATGLADIALEQALQSLPESHRAAFLLVRAEGFLYREAAEILGVPQGTVQARVSLAAKELRRALGYEPSTCEEVKGCIAIEPENA